MICGCRYWQMALVTSEVWATNNSITVYSSKVRTCGNWETSFTSAKKHWTNSDTYIIFTLTFAPSISCLASCCPAALCWHLFHQKVHKKTHQIEWCHAKISLRKFRSILQSARQQPQQAWSRHPRHGVASRRDKMLVPLDLKLMWRDKARQDLGGHRKCLADGASLDIVWGRR